MDQPVKILNFFGESGFQKHFFMPRKNQQTYFHDFYTKYRGSQGLQPAISKFLIFFIFRHPRGRDTIFSISYSSLHFFSKFFILKFSLSWDIIICKILASPQNPIKIFIPFKPFHRQYLSHFRPFHSVRSVFQNIYLYRVTYFGKKRRPRHTYKLNRTIGLAAISQKHDFFIILFVGRWRAQMDQSNYVQIEK